MQKFVVIKSGGKPMSSQQDTESQMLQVKMSGYLKKKRRKMGGWRKLWFVLQNQLLLSYTSKEDYEKKLVPFKDVVSLVPGTIIRPTKGPRFIIETSTNLIFTYRCDDNKTCSEWITALVDSLSLGAQTVLENKLHNQTKLHYSLDNLPQPINCVPKCKKPMSISRSWDSICRSKNVKSSPNLPIAQSTAKILKRSGIQQQENKSIPSYNPNTVVLNNNNNINNGGNIRSKLPTKTFNEKVRNFRLHRNDHLINSHQSFEVHRINSMFNATATPTLPITSSSSSSSSTSAASNIRCTISNNSSCNISGGVSDDVIDGITSSVKNCDNRKFDYQYNNNNNNYKEHNNQNQSCENVVEIQKMIKSDNNSGGSGSNNIVVDNYYISSGGRNGITTKNWCTNAQQIENYHQPPKHHHNHFNNHHHNQQQHSSIAMTDDSITTTGNKLTDKSEENHRSIEEQVQRISLEDDTPSFVSLTNYKQQRHQQQQQIPFSSKSNNFSTAQPLSLLSTSFTKHKGHIIETNIDDCMPTSFSIQQQPLSIHSTSTYSDVNIPSLPTINNGNITTKVTSNLDEPIYAKVDLKNKYACRAKRQEMEMNAKKERPKSFHVSSGDYEEVMDFRSSMNMKDEEDENENIYEPINIPEEISPKSPMWRYFSKINIDAFMEITKRKRSTDHQNNDDHLNHHQQQQQPTTGGSTSSSHNKEEQKTTPIQQTTFADMRKRWGIHRKSIKNRMRKLVYIKDSSSSSSRSSSLNDKKTSNSNCREVIDNTKYRCTSLAFSDDDELGSQAASCSTTTTSSSVDSARSGAEELSSPSSFVMNEIDKYRKGEKHIFGSLGRLRKSRTSLCLEDLSPQKKLITGSSKKKSVANDFQHELKQEVNRKCIKKKDQCHRKIND